MRIRELGLLAVVPAVLALAACGAAQDDGVASANGGSAKPTASSAAAASMSPEQAALKFAQCMRQHGVDMPDPKINGGKVSIRVQSKGVPRTKMDAAQKACQHFLAAGGKGHVKNDPKARAQMLQFAQCMRQHGIDMPDPKPGQGLDLRVPKGSRAKLQDAQKACQKYQPGGGPGLTRVGGAG